jgi:hypothetical protein
LFLGSVASFRFDNTPCLQEASQEAGVLPIIETWHEMCYYKFIDNSWMPPKQALAHIPRLGAFSFSGICSCIVPTCMKIGNASGNAFERTHDEQQ